MGILTDLFLQIQIHILEPGLGLQLPGGKIDKCSPICLSVHSSCHLLFQDMNLLFQVVNLLFQVMNLFFQAVYLLFQVVHQL